MHRLAAVSNLLVGSEKLWAGVMLAEPGTASSVHHHGPQETVVYVAEGRSTLRWGRHLEHETELEAGDFLFVPPYVPHQEVNPSADRPALWIVVRSGPEAVVVDLTLGADGEYIPTASGVIRPSLAGPRSRPMSSPESPQGRRGARRTTDRRKPLAPRWLPVASAAALVVAALGELWLWHGGQAGPGLVPTGFLAVAGAAGMAWASRAGAARHLAALDAYAEREINRRPG
jgi:uncharacterized RmlC-like cupin family protein